MGYTKRLGQKLSEAKQTIAAQAATIAMLKARVAKLEAHNVALQPFTDAQVEILRKAIDPPTGGSVR